MKQYSENVKSSVEEVSMKKHLPRRQHTEKPVLKYDGRPVPYHSQRDVIRPDSRSHPGSAPGSPTKYMAQNSILSGGSATIQRRARNGSSGSIHSSCSAASGLGEAFGRPFSAKEVIRDCPPSHRHRQFQLFKVGTGMSVLSPYNAMRHNSLENASDSNLGATSMPFRSILQPSNGVHYDSISTKISPQKREHSSVSQSVGDLTEFSSQEKDKGQFVPGRSQRSKMNSRVVSSSETLAFLHGVASANASHATSTGQPHQPKESCTKERQHVSNEYQTTNTSVHSHTVNDADGDCNSGHVVQNSENVGHSKKPRSDMSGKGTKPLSGSASYNSAQSHPEYGKLVTNGRVEPVSGDISSLAGIEDSGLPFHNLTASSLLNTRMGMLRKMPAAKPIPGTVHFKKSLLEASLMGNKKAVPMMLEHRHLGDGAPAKQTGMPADEKPKAAGVNEADEEEEDDVSMPSGERLPGDGEASDNDDLANDDDDDDGIDNLYDDNQNYSDGDSDDYSVGSSMSQASSSTVHLPTATSRPSTSQSSRDPSAVVGEERSAAIRPVTSSGEAVIQPALRRSLFTAIPPTINFVPDGEKVEQLPWEIRKLLKWRMSPITPNVVKAVLRRSNFRITKKNNDWLGCFGKHMKASGFKSIREYQKLNHFPGSFQLGRKDRLWRNLSRMQVSFGKRDYGFFPRTYVLPQDMKHLKRTWEDSTSRQKWIIKPPASARGIGIKVINKWTQIPRKQPVIVQRYLAKPLLINESKFDMRVYVYVASFDPLRAYIFEDGLARFASCKYSSSMKNLNNKFMHLTNFSINKRNAEYQSNSDSSVCQGHKWSLKSLWNYLENEGVNTHRLWESIKDIIIKTLISADGSINTMIKANVRSRYTVHELFGFDILLDDQLRPWILEVNISPSLHSSSPLDISIKGQLVRDMMNLAGFHVPDKNDIYTSAHNSTALPELSAHIPSNDYCIDKRLFTNQLSADERAKHAYYCHKSQDEQVLQGMLDTLTPDDVRILTESIDEDTRKGGFIRVFPTPTTKKYLRYFDQPRYYNLLLDQWVTRYHRMEQRGISILQSVCEDGIHLENPTNNISHQWCPPNSAAAMLSARDSRNSSPLKKDAPGQKFSVSTTRLPKVKNGMGDAQMTSATIVTGGGCFTHPSSPVSRPSKPQDPLR